MQNQRRICPQNLLEERPSATVFELSALGESNKGKLSTKVELESFLSSCGEFEQKGTNNKCGHNSEDPRLIFNWDAQFKVRVLAEADRIGIVSNRQSLENSSLAKRQSKERVSISVQNNVMRPRPLSSYCQICRQSFQDYLQHIHHANHQKKLGASSKTQKMIDSLVLSLNKSQKRAKSMKSIRDVDTEEDQICRNSSKIRIIEQCHTTTTVRVEKTNSGINKTALKTLQEVF